MKLELKHLAPYLPFELQVIPQIPVIDCQLGYNKIKEGKIVKLIGCYSRTVIIHSLYFRIRMDMIKPILRPLSDLTKEIEVNGEKFVPIEKLRELFVSNLDCGANSEGKWNIWLNQKTIASLNVLAISEIKEKLFEWHFDVFGLIYQGLAVDINTLTE